MNVKEIFLVYRIGAIVEKNGQVDYTLPFGLIVISF